VLCHVSAAKPGVAGTYNQYAYLSEKTVALERWAAHVGGIAAGKSTNNDVLPFAKVSSP
jgi:hypothetical protein